MKRSGKLAVLYIIIMIVCLVFVLRYISGLRVVPRGSDAYEEAELATYKKVHESMEEGIENYRRSLNICVVVTWSVALVGGLAVIAVIYRSQVRPVEQMQDFAKEIAKGNLDVPLPIHKGAHYGGFTESFDLMREELKASRQRELEADQAKRELAAELSHDLKTPVATMRATCDVLELSLKRKLAQSEGSETGQVGFSAAEIEGLSEKISILSDRINTVSGLVDDVFHANLDDMKEVQVSPEETESRWIEECFLKLKDYGRIILDDHIPECLVYLDKLRMEQVIDNVVGNSYKYAGTDIHVSFSEAEAAKAAGGRPSRFIRITVRDSGPGVPEDELPLVIEKYYRGKKERGKPGYGLGMYLVDRYMELQGGGLQYHNDGGFVVELFIARV
ncbi:MAG: HAMP domain-containing histidine kinase [Lachnospiraceae bacterium]|nr:HAMP domain-containing histidine kinase [Lachnospiraceae bacterium]